MNVALDYPVAVPPECGGALQLADGVHWARLFVPGSLRHINVWLLEDGDGWTLVDTGMNIAEARAAWEGPLHDYLAGRPLRRVVCTHHHPDHAGLAQFLIDRHGAELWMTPGEHAVMRTVERSSADASLRQARIDHFTAEGMLMTAELRALIGLRRYGEVMSGIPQAIVPVADGDVLAIGARRFTALVLGGHTDAHLVLHDAAGGLLISGDQVLPRISSNCGVYPERADATPLGSYLHSFDVLGLLPADVLVLPAHGNVFRGLHRRLAELRRHHDETLATLLAEMDEPRTAAELAKALFRRTLDPLNQMLAVGETLAHVRHLLGAGAALVVNAETHPRRYVRA